MPCHASNVTRSLCLRAPSLCADFGWYCTFFAKNKKTMKGSSSSSNMVKSPYTGEQYEVFLSPLERVDTGYLDLSVERGSQGSSPLKVV